MRKYTIHDFNSRFPDDDACLDYMRDLIYPDGIVCRYCGKEAKHHRISGRKAYSCQYCGTHVYPLAGTIFEKSRTPLKSWFYAMFLMSQTRCGISAKQLERELGVTYKTAWRMFHKIRDLMAEDVAPLFGEVEMDETYVGGKRRGHKRGRPGKDSHKVPVAGMVQRGGKVAALVTKDTKKQALMPLVREKVMPESMVYTDEYRPYEGLEGEGYKHERVPHAEKVYVIGNVHTNTIEGFWSLLKRGISGVYHSVSEKHLQRYLNEYAFRYNHRDDGTPLYETMRERAKRVRAGQHGRYAPIG
jgi:transposase-like protein